MIDYCLIDIIIIITHQKKYAVFASASPSIYMYMTLYEGDSK